MSAVQAVDAVVDRNETALDMRIQRARMLQQATLRLDATSGVEELEAYRTRQLDYTFQQSYKIWWGRLGVDEETRLETVNPYSSLEVPVFGH